MTNYIEHISFVELYNKDNKIFDELFKDCKTFDILRKRLNKLASRFKEFSYSEKLNDNGKPEGHDKMLGDMFEIFAELFFKILGSSVSIGVYNYKPEKPTKDVGVDGYGKYLDNTNLIVQVKYRSNITYKLLTGDLRNMQGVAYRQYKVPIDSNNNIIVFTSVKELHYKTKNEVFDNSVRVIGYNEICKQIDNNLCFWNMVMDYVKETIKIRYNV